jgi:hypothetical protein
MATIVYCMNTINISKKLYIIDGNKTIVNLKNGKKVIYESHKVDNLVYEVRDLISLMSGEYLVMIVDAHETDNYAYFMINIDNGMEFYFQEGNYLISNNKKFFFIYTVGLDYHDGGTFWVYDTATIPFRKIFKKKYLYPCEPKNFKWISDAKITFDLVCEEENASITNYILILKDNRWVLKNQKKIK